MRHVSVRGSVTTVLMPDVTGLTLEHAEAVIRSVLSSQPGITVWHIRPDEPSGRVSGPGMPDIVIAQLPAPGTRVAVNGPVTLSVPSTG